MTINEIMDIFKNPDAIHSLSVGDKLLGVGFTMVLGMGITFTALIILKIVMEVMSKALNEEKKSAPAPVAAVKTEVKEEAAAEENLQNDEALIAAITVALAAKLKTPLHNIVIRDIKRVNNSSNPWNHLGIVEQMNNRL